MYINPDKNYKLRSNGDIFTGEQLKNLLRIADPVQRLMLLLDAEETDAQPTESKGKYGVAGK